MARTDIVQRPLTPGERDIAASVFGPALDLDPVTLRHAKWWPLQPKAITMAPDGHVWFHPHGTLWCEDFAAASLAARALLVHELVHVWQRQSGINLVLRRPWLARYRYLPLRPGKKFTSYGLEQQACIVEDAYFIREGGGVVGAPGLDLYAALIPFGPGPVVVFT